MRWLIVVAAASASGCPRSECGSDADCKGARICVDGACTGEGEGEGEGEGVDQSCASAQAFGNLAGDGHISVIRAEIINDSSSTCTTGSPVFVTAQVTGSYLWSGSCGTGANTCASPAQFQMKLQGFGLGPCPDDQIIVTNANAGECVAPELCFLFCPLCMANRPADGALQIHDDVGLSDVACVDVRAP
jgi:hypothetical protein